MNLSVLSSVSDDDIYSAFGSIFGKYGNNVVERIKCNGMKKIVHISEPIYIASLVDDIHEDFKISGVLTFHLWEDWVYEDEEFEEGKSFKVYL